VNRDEIRRAFGRAKDHIPFSSKLLPGSAENTFLMIASADRGIGKMHPISDGDYLFCEFDEEGESEGLVVLFKESTQRRLKRFVIRHCVKSNDKLVYMDSFQKIFDSRDWIRVGKVKAIFTTQISKYYGVSGLERV